MRRCIGVAIMFLVQVVHASSAAASGAPQGCQIGQIPSFSLGFAGLRQQVGAAMGDPVECEHTDPNTGGAIQRTTTGLALYRRDINVPMFTNGQEHWALTASGLTHWSGWHGDAMPTLHDATTELEGTEQRTVPAGPYMQVDAVTITGILDEHGQRFIVLREGTSYLIEVEGPCASGPPTGDVVFVVSEDTFAGPESRVVLGLDGRECRITNSHALSP